MVKERRSIPERILKEVARVRRRGLSSGNPKTEVARCQECGLNVPCVALSGVILSGLVLCPRCWWRQT